MPQFKHTCIRLSCGNEYEDNDFDAYYCPSCQVKNKAIAEQVDKKLGTTLRKPIMSELQQFDEVQKRTGTKFPNAKDLGFF